MEAVKLQICCLLVMLFIAGIYFPVKRKKTYSHIIFSVSLWTCIFCLVFDIISVYTVNHLETVPPVVNRIVHDLFMGSMIMDVGMCYEYCLVLIHNDRISKKRLWVSAIPVWIAWIGLVTFPLNYVETPKGNYSWGPAVYTVHAILAVYIVCIFVEMARFWKEINPRKRYVIILAFCIMILVIIYQTCVPTSLVSSMVIMLVNLAFFLTVESPDILLLEQLKREKERADQANAAKSEFLSNMSHEIRTPMNAIVGMTDIALREDLAPDVREYLNNIKNSGDALLTIINDILDFSKIESGKLDIVEEEYEPMSMFHDLSMIFLTRIGEKDIELLYDIDPMMPTRLWGDDQRIRQVVLNLMTNAIKYTEKGFVRLKVQAETSGGDEIKLTFSVEDSGQGIRQEDLGKLFTSFQQVDAKKNYKKEGTGLGLAISKQLVDLMQGTIGVESTYGKGSTFTFTIPQKIVDVIPAARLKDYEAHQCRIDCRIRSEAAKEQLCKLADAYRVAHVSTNGARDEKIDFLITDDLTQVSEKEREHIRKSGGKICVLQNPMRESVSDITLTVINKPFYSLNFCQLLNGEEQVFVRSSALEYSFVAPKARILVADDSLMNLKVVKGLLAPYEIQIDTAGDGRMAFQMVQNNKYDIVFMDHMMPVMDGIEATQEIRKLPDERYQRLPIIALSANATSEARELFLQAGMDDFIAKPIREKELIACIQERLPEELKQKKEQETAKVSQEEDKAGDIEDLPVIEGLDVAEGIRYCGSQELFVELLGDFYRLIDSKSVKLEEYVREQMVRDYTIEVHALKNSARMIGAAELSGLFYEMEQLGNENRLEEITEKLPDLLKMYRGYKDILCEYVKRPEGDRKQVSVEVIRQTLMKLHDAVDVFDLDEADAAMKELEEYELPPELQQMEEELRVFVSDVAMEDILRLTDEMCGKLS